MDTEKIKILMVDDHEENLLALSAVLTDPLYDLITAHSGREALRHLLTTHVAVILLDVQMPGMDGYETAALIRARKQSEATPIIFLTAYEKSAVQVFKGYSVGAVDYIFKPVVPEIIKAKVAVFADMYQKSQAIKRHAEILAKMNNELKVEIEERRKAEDEVKILNVELQKNINLLSDANHALESFSYTVSHDLRAPLRHIEGFIGLLRKQAASLIDDKSKRYLSIISDSATKMSELIDDLLAFSRLGRVEMCTQKVNIDFLVREIIQELQLDASERKILWNISELEPVNADLSMMRQVFRNLLSNAVKFTRSRERAEISVSCRVNEKQEIEYCIADNGAGFDMQYAEKLFGVFQRLHTEAEFEGTGIGLAIVRLIVQRHGGRTWAKSALNKGASFYFTMPRKVDG